MNLRDYLLHHDGPGRTGALSKTGRELRRLAKAAGVSSIYTYHCALGHKFPSGQLALKFHEKSLGRSIDVALLLKRTPKQKRPSSRRSTSRR